MRAWGACVSGRRPQSKLEARVLLMGVWPQEKPWPVLHTACLRHSVTIAWALHCRGLQDPMSSYG
eukprot:200684-Pelagomonas_calceolata.AAC.1